MMKHQRPQKQRPQSAEEVEASDRVRDQVSSISTNVIAESDVVGADGDAGDNLQQELVANGSDSSSE